MAFTHLHVHSHYSLLSGLAKIEDLVLAAKKNGMTSLALTDHGVMYGVIEFYQACKKEGIKPIIGMEVNVAVNGRHLKRARIDEQTYHVVLLAKNNIGYKNLIQLTTKAHLEGYLHKPRVDLELLNIYKEGIICLSGCLHSELAQYIILGKLDKAKELIKTYQSIFGKDQYFLEVQPHFHLPHQQKVNDTIFQLSNELDVPVIATNDVHYISLEDKEAHDVLICLNAKKKKQDVDRVDMRNEDYSFLSQEQMLSYFSHFPQAIDNTQKIADMCDVEIALGQNVLPRFEVPQGYTDEQYLKESCYKGLMERFNIPYSLLGMTEQELCQKIQNASVDDIIKLFESIRIENAFVMISRLEYELSVIAKTGFASYFLIVSDFVKWAIDQDILVGPGRGSAAGSFVSYLMYITNVDPIAYDLLFERFLNPDRISMPDIDLDFADTKRDAVLQYVRNKYGEDHVCHIITFGTMAARAAVRDTGRVLGLPYLYCDEISKLIPMKLSLKEALEHVPELRQRYLVDPQSKNLIDMAMRLEGVARHTSIHACGVVISKEPLHEYLPYQYSLDGQHSIVSQYSLHPIEDIGLLKMDFLGLTNLTLLEKAMQNIKKQTGVDIDIHRIPLDDTKTYELFQKGQTTGIFQFESAGMKRYLKQLKPTNIEDLIAMVALYRPGPMEWIPQFIEGKHGKTPQYIHDKLQPILNKTYGVAVYQEQVMEISKSLAGFTPGEADVLRKAMGKKIAELLAQQKEKFIQGCVKNDISEDTAKEVFSFIEPFAGYGFNRSHAACYAIIAYQTAYLKANYPVEFMAALMTCDQSDTDRIAIEIEECRLMGIHVLPPHINRSETEFSVIQDEKITKSVKCIQYGFGAIKNFGEHIAQMIVSERQNNGNYTSLEHFLSRVRDKDLNKKSLESLIKSGVLDCFQTRTTLFLNMEKILQYHKNIAQETQSNQVNIFGVIQSETTLPPLILDAYESIASKQLLQWEKEFLGTYLSDHPLREYMPKLRGVAYPVGMLWQLSKGASVKVVGIIADVKRIITKKNETMLFVKLEDLSSSVEVLVFPRVFQENPDVWKEDLVVVVSGQLSDKEEENDQVKILAQEAIVVTLENVREKANSLKMPMQKKVWPKKEKNVASKEMGYLQQAKTQSNGNGNSVKPSRVYLRLQGIDKEKSLQLKNFLSKSSGECKVYLVISQNGTQKNVQTTFSVAYTRHIQKEMENMIGNNNVIFS